MFRKTVTSHANFIAKQLGLPKNILTTRFKLFIAFFLSGLIHHAGEYVIRQRWTGHSMEFFLMQAVAITCEDVIIALAERAGFSSKSIRLMGFVWVFVWFTYSLPLWLDETMGIWVSGVPVIRCELRSVLINWPTSACF
jgi:Membrane bound O-acyl transferase family